MSKSDNDTIITLKGERAAMGGFLAQYDIFASGIFEAMEAGTLEEIRVADMVDNVGKQDDVVYVTTDSVHAYQVKWSIIDADMAYPDFKKLIKEAVDGWRNLKRLYVDKTVFPYLLTNKSLTEGDYSIKALAGKSIGGFKAYEEEVLLKLKKGEPIDAKWDDAISELRSISTLTAEEWSDFWSVFSFQHDYQKETVEVSKIYEDQRIFDIICIHRMIEEIAGSKECQIKLTVRDIITRLNLEKRFDTKFDHNLKVPEDSYVPNTQGMVMLDKALQGKSKGYVFLKGSPGSGKSTLLTQWARGIKNPSVRFYAFDFLNPSSQRNNDSNRGSGLTFLHDIVLLIHKTGIEGNKTILPKMDYDALRERFYRQLDAISDGYKHTRIPYFIIVDGLDHITREYSKDMHTLMKVLPSPTDIPEGVVFVLGSQHYDHLGLNSSIEKELSNSRNLIDIPPLSKAEIEDLCVKLLPHELITNELIVKCWKKSQGHPLYLRYLLNHFAVSGAIAVEMMDDTPEEVEDYYARIVGTRLETYAVRDALGLIARIGGNMQMDDVRALCPEDALLDIMNHMRHLFIYDKGSQSLTFFHNSFRQYLLNKTSEDVLTGKFSRAKDIEYYKKLAEHFKDGWDEGYYLYSAEEYDRFLTALTPEVLFKQAQNYRPLWSIQRDLERGVEIARKRRDPYLLIRHLLLENQITQMDNQDLSVLSLIEEFIHSGRSTLAKAIVREGKQLHCSQMYALTLAIEYLRVGDKDEANILFSLSYPDFLSHKPEEHHNRFRDLQNKEEYLTKWVNTAGYFLGWADIEKHIAIFIPYLESFAIHDQEPFDSDIFRQTLIQAYLESLVEQERWPEFEGMINTLQADSMYLSMLFHSYEKAIIHLSKYDGEKEMMSRYFAEAERLHAIVGQAGILQLVMVNLAQRSAQPAETVKAYLEKTVWEEIGAYYQNEVGQQFETLKPHIFYVKTRAKYGYQDNMTILVPDNPEHEDNDLMVNYVRRVFSIAQMAGRAQMGVRDSSFISLITHSIRYFDDLEAWSSHHNKFAYTLSRQRKDFYVFVIQMATCFGGNMLERVARVFEHYFISDTCGADGSSRREAILTLFRKGYDPDWCKNQLSQVDALMMTWRDLDGRVNEALQQGRGWLEMKCYNKAEVYFHQMIEETFGVGYRKDYQPSLFAGWLGEAMQREPEHAVEYVHWMTTRLRHLDEIAETRTSYRAAHELLYETLKFNLRSGLKLSFWLLDQEYELYQSVSSVILLQLLKRANSASEYKVLFRMFTDLHLYYDENDSYELDTTLIKAFVDYGRQILKDDYPPVLQQMRLKIRTECPENIVEGLLTSLDGILKLPVLESEKVHKREREDLLAQAKRLREAGRNAEAWTTAIDALADSSASGWARYYDGGSRLDICKELQKIDSERGREFTIDLFANDIPKGFPYGALQNIEEIVPLLTDKLDQERLFKEEFAYMNRILRDDICNEKDKPEIEPADSSINVIVRDWLLYLVKMPVISVSERSKIQLAYLHHETGVSVLDVLNDDVHSERLKLEIGCYLSELGSKRLSDYCEIARKSALSPNYQYRLYANTILLRLGEPIPEARRRALPAIYSFMFPQSENPSAISWLSSKELVSGIDWKDASSVMGVASKWNGYLSHCTGIDKRTLDFRAIELMKKYGDNGESNIMVEKHMEQHYDRIGIKCLCPRPHTMPAFDGVFEVAAELLDGGVVPGRYYDGLFMSRDFSNILIDAIPKPDFVQRIASADSWRVQEDWILKHGESPRLNEEMPEYNGCLVIGEYTHVKKVGDNPAMEEYEADVSYIEDCDNEYGSSIFGESAFLHLTSEYLNIGKDDPETVLLRGGYYSDFSNKNHWIAINPAMAIKFGWKPSEDGYFAWNDAEGKRMVESLYWQSGNIFRRTRNHYEVGDGWIVVASAEAMTVIRQLAPVYLHKKVLRRRGSNPEDMTHQTIVVKKM